jgi:hypothetical protein
MKNKVLLILSVGLIVSICHQCQSQNDRIKKINKLNCVLIRDMSYEGIVDTVFFYNKEWRFRLKEKKGDEYTLYTFPHHTKSLKKGNYVKKIKGNLEYRVFYSESDSFVLQSNFSCDYWDTLRAVN